LIALRKDDEADAIFQSPQRRSLTLWNSSSKTPFPLGTLRGKNWRRRRSRRIRSDKLISRHFWQGHLEAMSLGKTMGPQLSQITLPLATTAIGRERIAGNAIGTTNLFLHHPRKKRRQDRQSP
jgi:hypothetical protein